MATPTLDLSMIGQNDPRSAPPAQPESFADRAGGWIKNNLSTVGSIAAPLIATALAPETGGLSLAALAAGGALAGNVGSQVANGKSVISGDSLKSDLGQTVLGAASDFGGQLVGKAVGKAGEILGNGLAAKGEGLALSSLGIKQGAANTFGAANKEALSDFISRTGQIGDAADKVAETTQGMGQAYDQIARQSGVKVPVSQVGEALDQAISEQGKPVTSAGQQFIQKLQNEKDTIIKNLVPDAEGNIDIGQLADAKSELQRTAYGNRATNPTNVNDVEQTFADSLMQKLNSVAEENGLKTADGKSLSELGSDLQKQYRFNNLAQKAAYSSASVAKPINTGGILKSMGGAGAGFLAGGPVGAAVGAVGEPLIEAAANTPGALKVLSKGATAAAPIISNIASKSAGTLGVAGQAGIMGLGNATSNAMNEPPTLSSSQGPSNVPASPDLSGDLAGQAADALRSGQPLTQSQYQAILEKDLATTGGRYQSQITAAYNAGNPQAVQGLGVASNALNTLQSLFTNAGGAQGPISGRIESALGSTGLTAKSVQSYNQQKLALGQEIISQIYGSSGTASDRDQVLSLLPDVDDSSETAQSKISTLKSLIQQRLSSMTGSTPSSVSSLAGGPSLNLAQ